MKQKLKLAVDDNGIIHHRSNATSKYLGAAHHPHVDCYVVRLDAYITSSVVKRQLSLYPVDGFKLKEPDAAGIATLFFKSRYKPCSMPLVFLYKCKNGTVIEVNLIENTFKLAAMTQSAQYETFYYDREKAEADVKWYNDWFDKNRVIGTRTRRTSLPRKQRTPRYSQEIRDEIVAEVLKTRNGQPARVDKVAKKFGVSPQFVYQLKREAIANNANPLEAAMCDKGDDAVDLITQLREENARLMKENESLIASLKIVSRKA